MIAGVAELAACVWNVCRTFNASVTSWVRSPAHNHFVGGMDTSHHIGGRAMDVAYDNGAPPLDQVRAIADQWGVKLVRESDHDHFQI